MKSISILSVRRVLGLSCAVLLALPLAAQQAWDGNPGVSFDDQKVVFELDPEEPMSLLDLVELARELDGTVFSLSGEPVSVRTLLQAAQLDLIGRLEIPRPRFRRFFEERLMDHQIVAMRAADGRSDTVRLILDNVQTRGTIKNSGVHLRPEQVRARADEPCLYVLCIRRLEFGQAQSLGINLRTALSTGSPGADTFMPLPNENALLVQGFAPFVAQALDLLDQLDVRPLNPPPSRHSPSLKEVAEAAGAPAAAGAGAETAADGPELGLIGLLDDRLVQWCLLALAFLLLFGNRLAIRGVREELKRLGSRD